MSDPTGPHLAQFENPVKWVNITNYVFPWIAGKPLLMECEGSDDFFLPVYSSPEKLVEHTTPSRIAFDSIKRIDDMLTFLENLPAYLPTGEALRVIIDPWITDTGTIRFVEVYREDIHGSIVS